MDRIPNHADMAKSYIVPYLREFAGLTDIAGANAERWQTVEDCLWFILKQLNVDTASDFWLDLLGEKAGQSRELYATPTDAFRFDSETLGLGETIGDGLGGDLLEGIGSAGKVYVSLQDELYRLVIKFAMVRNNYDAKRDTIIQAIKILTNAQRVFIRSIPPLKTDIIIKAAIPNDYLSVYISLIESILPQCVELNNLYQEDLTNSFQFDSEEFGLGETIGDLLGGKMDYIIN